MLTPYKLLHRSSRDRRCGTNDSHSVHHCGNLGSLMCRSAAQMSDTDDWSQSRYVSSFLAPSCIKNWFKSCIHSEELPASVRSSTRDRFWSFCIAIGKCVGERIRSTNERNSEDIRGDGLTQSGRDSVSAFLRPRRVHFFIFCNMVGLDADGACCSLSCERNHSLAPLTSISTGICAGSRKERTLKRLLISEDSSFNLLNCFVNVIATDRSS
jgi:hypothetical protein